MKTLTTIILTTALAMATQALADDVLVKGLPYNNAKVTAFAEGKVTFELSSGSTVSKEVETIDLIKLTGQDSFNDAEEKASKGKFLEAIKAYDQAMDRADVDWLKELVALRRLKALGQTTQIDRSTKEWLALMESTKGSRMALAMRPDKVGTKTSRANVDAAKAIEDAIKAGSSAEAQAAMRKLLMEIYSAMGKTEEAAKLAAQLTGTTTKGTGETSTAQPTPSGSSLGDQLSALQMQLDADPKSVLDHVQKGLKVYTAAELPRAMLLAGKAQMRLREKASEDQKQPLLLDAGLNFMRVVTFYPTTPEAPEALYEAGMVNVQMGNRKGARAAFQKLADIYKDSEYAAKAQEQIKKLEAAADAAK